MQYLVSGVPAGAPAGTGSWTLADTGEAAAITPKAMINIRVMPFLLDRQVGIS